MPDQRPEVTVDSAGSRRLASQLLDADASETTEWLESLDAVVDHAGRNRAHYLMLSVLQRARERQVGVPDVGTTDYINTIPPEMEPTFPGDESIERRIRAFVRWNAAIMVHRAQRPGIEVGGHISTYASAAALYEVGFNHFFRGRGMRVVVTRSTSRAMHPLASTLARSSKGASPRTNSTDSDKRSPQTGRGAVYRPTRTRVGCRTSGSFPPSRWDSRPSTRSTRHGSTGTC